MSQQKQLFPLSLRDHDTVYKKRLEQGKAIDDKPQMRMPPGLAP